MTLTTRLIAAAALTFTTGTAVAQNPVGAFVEGAIGASALALDDIGVPENGDADHSGTVGKIGAGYWFSEHWGASVSYVEMGDFTQKYGTKAFRGSAKSYGASLLGRVPLTQKLSLVGKLNLVKTEMKDNGSTITAAQTNKLTGDESSIVLPGIELDYQMTPRTTLFLELDPRGSAGDKVDVGYVGLGVRMSF